MHRPPPTPTLFPYTTLFRSAAQDTSAAGHAPDTSGYNGTGGVDTSAQPGRVGAIDTTAGVTDTLRSGADTLGVPGRSDQDRDRKSTRLNSSHRCISYAVFCL